MSQTITFRFHQLGPLFHPSGTSANVASDQDTSVVLVRAEQISGNDGIAAADDSHAYHQHIRDRAKCSFPDFSLRSDCNSHQEEGGHVRPWVLLARRVNPITFLGHCRGGAIGVGVWQLDRLKQRRLSIPRVLAVQAMARVKLPADAGQEVLPDMQYRPPTTGTYDFAHQVVLRNQYYNGASPIC